MHTQRSRVRARRAVDDDAVALRNYSGYPELARAAVLPVGAELYALLSSIDTAVLDAGGHIRLAQQWARLEAATCGQKLAAVAAMAGPEPTIEQIADNLMRRRTSLQISVRACKS